MTINDEKTSRGDVELLTVATRVCAEPKYVAWRRADCGELRGLTPMMLKSSEGTSVSCGQTTFRALDSRTARVTVLHIPEYVVPHDVADNQVPAHTEKHVSATI